MWDSIEQYTFTKYQNFKLIVSTVRKRTENYSRDQFGRFTPIELIFTRIYEQKIPYLCVENSENSVRFQIIEQHTWDTSTLKSNIYRLMKIAQRRKASVEVRKLSFIYSHNSHLVWEWSNVDYKANFVAWKNYMLIAFRKLSSIFYFHFEIQKVYLNRDRAGEKSWKFETLRLNSTGTFSRSELHTSCDGCTTV